MTHESGQFISPEPEPILHVPTIHEIRRRLRGYILSQEVELRLLSEPFYAIAVPSTPQEEEAAIKELEEFRKSQKDERLRRDGEFGALWAVSDIIDELENTALKQADNSGETI